MSEWLTLFGGISSILGLVISIWQVLKCYRNGNPKTFKIAIVVIAGILFLVNVFFFSYLHFEAPGIFPSGYGIKVLSVKDEITNQFYDISQGDIEIISIEGQPVKMMIEGTVFGYEVYKVEERKAFAYGVITTLDTSCPKWKVHLKGKSNVSNTGHFQVRVTISGETDDEDKPGKLKNGKRFLMAILIADYLPEDFYPDVHDLGKWGRPISLSYRFIVNIRKKQE